MTRISNHLVVDSWAWLELFSGSARGKMVEEEMAKAETKFTSCVSVAEIVSVSIRRGRPTEDKVSAIRSLSKVIYPTFEDTIESGALHAKIREHEPNFSLSDAFVLQAARKMGGKVLTGDPDFRGIKDAVLVE